MSARSAGDLQNVTLVHGNPRRRRLTVLLVVALASLAALGRGRAASAPENPRISQHIVAGGAPVFRAAAPGDPLAVQYTYPARNDVEVDPEGQFVVQFNRPVTTLTALTQRSTQQVLAFDPPVSGSGRWLTSSLYTFRPDPPLRAGSAYRAEVLASLPGGSLAAPYDFAFSTIAPAVADVAPRDNTKFVDPVANVQVLFNQPVDHAAAQAAFGLRADGAPIAGFFDWPNEQTLVFAAADPLPRGAAVTASIAEGVPGAGGAAGTAKGTSWSFVVAPSPRVQGSKPANGDTSADLGVSITFASPMDRASVEAAITLEPAPDTDNPLRFFWSGDTQLNLGYSFQYSSTYRISIAGTARDRYGVSIAEPYSFGFTTRPRPPAQANVSLLAGSVATLNAYLPAAVYVATINVQMVRLALYSIPAADFRRVSLFSPQDRAAYRPPADALRSWNVDIAGFRQDATVQTLVPLSDQGPGTLPPGFYLLDETAAGGKDRALFEVSRTSLVVKRGADDALVWAADLSTGAPVASTPVTLIDGSGNTVANGVTAADGTLRVSVPRVPSSNVGSTLFASLERTDDVAMASQTWSGSATPFSFNLSVSLYPQVIQRSYLYTDRPIYRAGETVHLRHVLRTDDDGTYSLPADLGTLTVQLTDPRGTTVQSLDATLDDFGSLAVDLKLPEEAATGTYFVRVARGTSSFGSGSFLVAEFRVPEFQVAVTTDRPAYVNGATIRAGAQADLFFGTHLADAEVAWTFNSSPYVFHPADKAYDGFSFVDFDQLNPPGTSGVSSSGAPSSTASRDQAGAGRTDADGHATLSVPASAGDPPQSRRLTVAATVTDENRQQVSASSEVIVHRAALYAGIKPQQYFAPAGKPAGVDLVTVNTTGAAAGGVAVQIQVSLRTWVNTQKTLPDGSTQYSSSPKDTPVDAKSLVTTAGGRATYSFTPAQGGQYRITVSGKDVAGNTFQSAASIYITSSDFLSWRVTPDARIELVADRDEYTSGDTAHVLVPSPYAGAIGLVSIERGRVISYTTQQFPTNSTVVDVPITAAMAPTVYLSVVLFKPGQSADDAGGYRAGYVKLAVSPAGHAIYVTLTPDRAKLGPGETVSFTVKTVDATGRGVPAEVSLALVDQAVLSLANDRSGPILATFYGPRSLGVATGATGALSLNAANQARASSGTAARTPTPSAAARAPGLLPANGDGGPAPSAARNDFQNTAYWKGDVRTDAAGDAAVRIKLPDNLTTWRLDARGVTTDTAAGDGTASIVTAKDLVVRPVTPRFFTASDSTRLETQLTNTTNAPLVVTVNLAATGLAVSGGAQRVTVQPGRSALVGWDTLVGEVGPVKVTFTASAATGQSDAVALMLPVNQRSTPETVASSGIITGDPVREMIQIPGNARQAQGSVTVELNASLSGELAKASLFIQTWRYEAADVTAARLLDATARLQAAQKLQQPAAAQDEATATALAAIRRLLTTRLFNSGWGWWNGGPVSVEITARVLFALGSARRAGLEVSADSLKSATAYMTGVYDRATDAAHPPDLDSRAFWLLAAAMSGNGSTAREKALSDAHRTLSDSGKGALLLDLLLDGTDPGDPAVRALEGELSSTAITSAAGTHWEDVSPLHPGFANSTRATTLVLLALLQLDPAQPLLDGGVRWLNGVRRDGYWRSIDETALAINTVSAYVVAREQPVEGLSYFVGVNGAAIGSGDIPAADPSRTISLSTPLGGLPVDMPLPVDIRKSGGWQLYYGLYLRYYAPTDEVSSLSNGIAVAREIWPADNDTPVNMVKEGDLVRVHLTIVAPSDLQFVQVEDFLPAGLEAVDASLKITSPALVARQREDQRRLLQLPANQTGTPLPVIRRFVFNPFTHIEVRDDRVALFAESLSRGVHEYVYYARATNSGVFLYPPTVAQESDFPDIFARSDSSTLVVTR